MEGTIMNFRGSYKTQRASNHVIIVVNGVSKKEKAASLVGKSVSWKSSADKEIKGKISSSHGNKGAVRAIFEKGLPGQSLGQKVKIE